MRDEHRADNVTGNAKGPRRDAHEVLGDERSPEPPLDEMTKGQNQSKEAEKAHPGGWHGMDRAEELDTALVAGTAPSRTVLAHDVRGGCLSGDSAARSRHT